jgi:hypothetical protein
LTLSKFERTITHINIYLQEYRDIFLNRSTEDLNDYLIIAIEAEEYELCAALKKLIEER